MAVKTREQVLKEALFFSDFAEGVTLVEGRKGTGKTTFAICVSYKLKELFGRPVICDFRPKPEFGPYTFLDEKSFVGELEKITKIAKSTSKEDVDLAVEWSLKKHNINLYEATMVLDESYRYFDSRTPSDKLVRIFGYFISQSRHYKLGIFLLTPRRDMIDKRVRTQVDRLVKVAYNPLSQVVHARVLDYNTGATKRIKIYGPNWFDLYDSWSAIALRRKVLEVIE